MIDRGEVCWAELPGLGRKPVLVVSSRVVTHALRPVVVRVTSVERTRPIPTAVALDDDEVPGLERRSWIVCHDLLTLREDIALEPIGRLSVHRMLDVEDALRVVLGLP